MSVSSSTTTSSSSSSSSSSSFSLDILAWPRPGNVVPYDSSAWGSPPPITSAFDLFVRNKTDEFVAALEAVPSRRFAWWPQRLVVTEYNRDKHVMARFDPSAAYSGRDGDDFAVNCATLRCSNVLSHTGREQQQQLYRQAVKKVTNFVRYLRDRGKAGVIVVNPSHAASRIFVLPGQDDAAGELRLLRFVGRGNGFTAWTGAAPRHLAQHQHQHQHQQTPHPSASAAVAVASKKSGSEGQAHGEQATVRGGGGGGLGGLGSTQDAVRALCAKARARLKAFHEDEAAERLEFEVMDDMARYYVVEEVAEFRGELVDVEEGGPMLDEKFVVVYKRGRLPRDVAVRLGDAVAEDCGREADEAAAAATAAVNRAALEQQGGVDAGGTVEDLAVVGQNKRDRRNVNDIMLATEATAAKRSRK
jgi:hypothetical protein